MLFRSNCIPIDFSIISRIPLPPNTHLHSPPGWIICRSRVSGYSTDAPQVLSTVLADKHLRRIRFPVFVATTTPNLLQNFFGGAWRLTQRRSSGEGWGAGQKSTERRGRCQFHSTPALSDHSGSHRGDRLPKTSASDVTHDVRPTWDTPQSRPACGSAANRWVP